VPFRCFREICAVLVGFFEEDLDRGGVLEEDLDPGRVLVGVSEEDLYPGVSEEDLDPRGDLVGVSEVDLERQMRNIIENACHVAYLVV
jgi:hypothetical protein